MELYCVGGRLSRAVFDQKIFKEFMRIPNSGVLRGYVNKVVLVTNGKQGVRTYIRNDSTFSQKPVNLVL